MPESFATRCGGIDSSQNAWTMAAVIASAGATVLVNSRDPEKAESLVAVLPYAVDLARRGHRSGRRVAQGQADHQDGAVEYGPLLLDQQRCAGFVLAAEAPCLLVVRLHDLDGHPQVDRAQAGGIGDRPGRDDHVLRPFAHLRGRAPQRVSRGVLGHLGR